MKCKDRGISQLFHVKRLKTEGAVSNLFVDISEVLQVGSEGANGRRANAATMLAYFLG